VLGTPEIAAKRSLQKIHYEADAAAAIAQARELSLTEKNTLPNTRHPIVWHLVCLPNTFFQDPSDAYPKRLSKSASLPTGQAPA